MLGWGNDRLDLTDDAVRQVFAQELVNQLRRVGTATLPEMLEANFAFMRVPADDDELERVLDVAHRLGWVEPDAGGGAQRWAITQAGAKVPPPQTLHVAQVAARILQTADPVRQRAKDWLPIVAIVVGALAARQAETEDGGGDSLTAIRLLSIAVLVAALVRGGAGEWRLLKAMRAWRRIQNAPHYGAIVRFYSHRRLVFVTAFDALVVCALALALFLEWWLAGAAALLALAVAACLEFVWRRPERKVRLTRPPAQPPTSPAPPASSDPSPT